MTLLGTLSLLETTPNVGLFGGGLSAGGGALVVKSGVRWRPGFSLSLLCDPPGLNSTGVEAVVPCGWISCTSFTTLKFSSTNESRTLSVKVSYVLWHYLNSIPTRRKKQQILP